MPARYKDGLFLESRHLQRATKTLWLLHWEISTNVQEPLFAWDRLLNFWHRPDFTRGEVISVSRGGGGVRPRVRPQHGFLAITAPSAV
jgi:hypothetical protein